MGRATLPLHLWVASGVPRWTSLGWPMGSAPHPKTGEVHALMLVAPNAGQIGPVRLHAHPMEALAFELPRQRGAPWTLLNVDRSVVETIRALLPYIAAGSEVAFAYASPGAAPSQRRVSRLFPTTSGESVGGLDLHADALRTFRYDRILEVTRG